MSWALGGGSVLDEDTRALLAAHRVVYLSMEVDEAVKRTGLNAARPLLAINPRKQWRELMEARRHLYAEVARAVVPTDGRTPEDVTQAVLDALPVARWTKSTRAAQGMEGTSELTAPAGVLSCGTATLGEDRSL